MKLTQSSSAEKQLRLAEWAAAFLISGLTVILHFVFLRHGGALWRDEAGAINLAEMPSLKDVWTQLYFDSFPVFWLLVARFWCWIGMGSDFGFRVLGFITGLLLLGSIWFTGRCLKTKCPFITLVLIGLNPLIIIYGDSMRAWGWGLIWITMEFGLLWLVLDNPTRARVTWAVIVAIAAVQSTYFNSVILFVFCCAGVIAALGCKLWKRAALIAGICAIAGVTMLPYLNVFRIGQEHYSILRQDFQFQDFTSRLATAVSGEEPFSKDIIGLWVWWLPLLLALVVTAVGQFLPIRAGVTGGDKQKQLFGLLTIWLAGPAYFLFLHQLRYVTSPWYYMPLFVAVALGLEAIISVLENWPRARLIRLFSVLALFAAAVPPINGVINLRMTNVDLIAAQLKRSAGTNDLIVVNPFYCGISFGRQYSGPVSWLTLPVVDTKMHRYDEVRALIMDRDRKKAIQEILDKSRSTLKAGGVVWIATSTPFNLASEDPEPWPPHHYKNPSLKQALAVQGYWQLETTWYLQNHSLHHEFIPVLSDVPVNQNEDLRLIKVTGWRD